MTILFTDNAWEDYLYWQDTDEKTSLKIRELIKVTQRTPFKGTGKPEALKNDLKGYWSRRITREHRFVYKITGTKPNQTLIIIQLRFHY